jgi:hypothetical protein
MLNAISPFASRSPFPSQAQGVRPTFTSGPSISGNTVVGDTLTVTATATGNGTVTYAYQWFRDTTPVGTNSTTYVTEAAGVHTCRVTASHTGAPRSASSNPITTFAAGGPFSAAFSAAFSRSV